MNERAGGNHSRRFLFSEYIKQWGFYRNLKGSLQEDDGNLILLRYDCLTDGLSIHEGG